MASIFWLGAGAGISAGVMAVCTLGLCPLPIGALCGGVGLIILPVSILEIISGIVGLASPRGGRVLMIVTGAFELLSIFILNPVAVIAGGVSMALALTNR